jgi:hypothetical protein
MWKKIADWFRGKKRQQTSEPAPSEPAPEPSNDPIPEPTVTEDMTITRGLVIGTVAAEPPPDEEEELTQGILYDGSNGVNSFYWNRHLKFQWKNVKGDWLDANQTSQGSTPYGSVTLSVLGTDDLTHDITGLAPLVQRWVDGTNRGVLMKITGSGSASIYSRHDATSGNRPVLTVTASGSGTTICDCTADSYALSGSLATWDSDTATMPFADNRSIVMQFDVSDVSGTVTAATLTLTSDSRADDSITINVYEIDCPMIWTGDTEGQTVETGLANNTYWDAEINSQAGVYYGRPHNHGFLQDMFIWNDGPTVSRASVSGTMLNDNDASFGNNPPFPYETELRDYSVEGKFITTDSVSAGWKWFFDQSLFNTGPPPVNTSDPEEAYFRFYVYLDDDFLTTVDDMKAAAGAMCIKPGTGFGSGGDPSVGTNGYRAHPHIGKNSADASNPYSDLHSIASYIYHMGQENTFGDSADSGVDGALWGNTTRWGCGTSGGTRGGDGFPGICLQRGRWYCFDGHIAMNSVVGSPTPADGILEWWVNGVKVYSRSNFRWRSIADLKVQSFWCNWYHGGLNPPNVEMHWRMTNFVVASSYIGPMRMEAVPSWAADTAGQLKLLSPNNTFASTNPSVYPDASYPSYGNSFYTEIEAFSGGVFNPFLGKWGSIIFHGGGHAAYWGNQVVKYDLETGLYAMAHDSSVLPSRNSGSPSNNVMDPITDPDPVFDATHCEYGDGKPGSAHTYDGLEIVPPWSFGGTKGALMRPLSVAVHPRNSGSTGWAHRFSFADEDWERWSTNGLNTSLNPGSACAFDPRRNRIWWFAIGFGGLTIIRYLNLLTQTQTEVNITSSVSPVDPDSTVMRYDAERDILLLVYPDDTATNVVIRYLTGLSNATPTGWQTPTLSQSIPTNVDWAQNPLDYVPDVDRWFMVAPDLSNLDGVWEIQIPTTVTDTWTVTKRVFSGITTFPLKRTASKRWSYSPKLKNFVWHSRNDQPGGAPYVYRPHGVT